MLAELEDGSGSDGAFGFVRATGLAAVGAFTGTVAAPHPVPLGITAVCTTAPAGGAFTGTGSTTGAALNGGVSFGKRIVWLAGLATATTGAAAHGSGEGRAGGGFFGPGCLDRPPTRVITGTSLGFGGSDQVLTGSPLGPPGYV